MTDEIEHAIREAAYVIWEKEGRPEGRADEHWHRAAAAFNGAAEDESLGDEEKIMAGRADANLPALLTKDVKGG